MLDAAGQALMARLHLELLGGFAARLNGDRPCRLPTRKAQALLAYLAVPAGRFHSRDKLTALLWGDVPEQQARQSFRQALAGLRRSFGEAADALLTEGDTIALDPQAVGSDVAEIEAARGETSIAALERAAALCNGGLLDGLRVDEPAFEEWLATERERLHQLSLDLLGSLMRHQREAGAVEAATQTALRLLGRDPLQEHVHRALMQMLLQQGRKAAALQQYQACVGWLERELGAEPEEATRELYREILRSAGAPQGRPASRAAPSVLPTAGEAPLIGREAELARLDAALARMLDQGGQVVLLRGEAGIGKSRLIREFSAHAAARGLPTALGLCHETEQILPLQPWVDALRGERGTLDLGLVRRLGPGAAQLARVFPELQTAGTPESAGEQYAQLFDALIRLIAELTAERPLVLVVEDLHWADGLSARFLAFLARRVERLRLLVVGSMRPEDLVDAPILAQALTELRAAPQVEEIALAPLSEQQSRSLIGVLQRAGEREAREQLAREVWALSEGNPFVILESMRARRAAAQAGAADQPPLARPVHDFIAERLQRLGERPRHVVAVAAVIGRGFGLPLLMAAAGMGELEAAETVEELVRRQIFVAAGDGLDFQHDRIRRVAYERQLPQRRALLHAAVGEALEVLHRERPDDIADQLGHHYSRAGDAAKAVLYLLRFAELAAQRYALDDALRVLGQAMGLVGSLPPAERDRRVLDLALRQAFVLSILGRQREIAALLDRHAERVARVADPLLGSEYHFRVGLTCFYLGERARGQRAAEQALAEAERAGGGEAIGKALHVLSLNAFEAGRPADGIAFAERAIPLLDLPRTQAWYGLAQHDLALNRLLIGDLDGALTAARREDAVGLAAEWPRLRALAGYVIAWVLATRGEAVLAIETARQSLALSRDPMVASLISGALGFAELERGDAASAIAILTDVVERLRASPVRTGELRHLALLAEAHLEAGDHTRARAAVEQALAASEKDAMLFNTALATRILGRIAAAEGNLDEAARRLDTALATFAACDARFEMARTRVLLAPVAAGLGRDDQAGQELEAALAVFKAANAPRRAEAAMATARSLGLSLGM